MLCWLQIYSKLIQLSFFFFQIRFILWGFPWDSDGKESACSAEDPDLIPESGRSPGEGNGYPLQYSGLGNSMDYLSKRVGHD